MAREFLPYDLDQQYLLPPSVHEWLPPDHLVFFVSDLVDSLDLAAITREYEKDDLRGRAGYHPVMLTKLLVYAYCVGKPSSRRIERATYEEVPFRVLTGNQHPDHDSIAAFRKRHLAALAGLFLQVLRLCQKAGLVRLGHVALDGTKLRANASKHKAMSYERLVRSEQELALEVKRLLGEAERTDAEEDRTYGKLRGDELPAELALRKSRLEKIREAKAALEAEARKATEDEAEKQKERRDERERKEAAEGRKSRGRRPEIPDPEKARPRARAQKNFTDPDSCLMKDGATGGFIQAYNAHAVVDDARQVIVACSLSAQPSDAVAFLPILREMHANLGEQPMKLSADSGFFSAANLAPENTQGIDCHVPPQRPMSGPVAEEMRKKLQTNAGAEIYCRRKAIVEPVFGQIKQSRGFRQSSFRGLPAVRHEWEIICLTHNLLKLFRAGLSFQAT